MSAFQCLKSINLNITKMNSSFIYSTFKKRVHRLRHTQNWNIEQVNPRSQTRLVIFNCEKEFNKDNRQRQIKN